MMWINDGTKRQCDRTLGGGGLMELVEDRAIETGDDEAAGGGLSGEGALQHSAAYPGGVRMLRFRRRQATGGQRGE